MSKVVIDRAVVERALRAWDGGDIEWFKWGYAVMEDLRTALAEPVQDAELSAALGWPGGVSTPELDRARLLQMVATLISQRDDLLQALKKIRGFTVNGAVVYAAMVDINAVASRAIKAAEAKE